MTVFPKVDDKEYQKISEDVKIIVEEHGSDACHNYATLGPTYCIGQSLPGASGEVKEQFIKNVMNCFKIFTTGAFV